MRAVEEMITRAASTDATVLISGESGVGKELVAHALHERSPRRPGPFVKVNCAALPSELLESELFGYERGAFTGAHRPKPGKFELANAGTIFLDEIGEMPAPLQAKMLQVLQDRVFSRLGSQRDIRVDVRIIAATNQDLGELVLHGDFRKDLFYRLNVVNIRVPPLRHRREEVSGLVEIFLRRYSEQYGRTPLTFSPDTIARFMAYPWPGNIRELENVVKRAVVLSSDAWVHEDLPLPAQTPPPPLSREPESPSGESLGAEQELTIGLREIARRAARAAEREALKRVLDRVRWNRVAAARLLKVNYKTLLSKIQECGLSERARPS